MISLFELNWDEKKKAQFFFFLCGVESNIHGAEESTRHASVTTLLSAGSEICQLSSSISVSGVSVCLAVLC